MNLHLSYEPFFIVDGGPISTITPAILLLDLLYLNFCITLAMALLALVLLTALLLKNDDLFSPSMAYDSCFDRGIAADLCVFTAADDKGLNINFRTLLPLDAWHSKRLATFDRELFTAGLYYCVTHFYLSPAA